MISFVRNSDVPDLYSVGDQGHLLRAIILGRVDGFFIDE
jgi:hypothetical protein